MKSVLIITTALTLLGVQSQFDKIEEVEQHCVEESGIDPEPVEDKEGKKHCTIDEDVPHLMEYSDCFGKGMHFIDENRNPIIPNIFKFKTEVQLLDTKLVKKILDKCITDDRSERQSLDFAICSCQVETQQRLIEKCIRKTGVEKKLVEDNFKCIVADDPKLKGYLVCVSKGANIISSEGDILDSGLRDYLEQVVKIQDKDRVNEIVEKCSKEEETPEETVFKVRKCLCSEIQ